jgi:hypothetical protein
MPAGQTFAKTSHPARLTASGVKILGEASGVSGAAPKGLRTLSPKPEILYSPKPTPYDARGRGRILGIRRNVKTGSRRRPGDPRSFGGAEREARTGARCVRFAGAQTALPMSRAKTAR